MEPPLSEQPTDQSTAPATGEAGPATDAPKAPSTPEDFAARIAELEQDRDKYKALMRQEETKKKGLYDELQQIKTAGMSETERAFAEAEARGREAALAELAAERKSLKLAAAAAQVGVPDDVLDLIDANKVFDGDNVNLEALKALSGPKSKFQKSASDLGIGAQSSAPAGQLTREQIRGWSPKEIDKARKEGRLDAVMKGQL